jgi:hypothetical protein
MNRLILDQVHHQFMVDWATRNGWIILDSSTQDDPSKQAYAHRFGGMVVVDPRGGSVGYTLIVRAIPPEQPNVIALGGGRKCEVAP